jgi:hypothetical protein
MVTGNGNGRMPETWGGTCCGRTATDADCNELEDGYAQQWEELAY